MTSKEGIWYQQEFRLYLGSTAFSGIAFAMQQLLLSWILIGILELPATQVGVIQAAVGIRYFLRGANAWTWCCGNNG